MVDCNKEEYRVLAEPMSEYASMLKRAYGIDRYRAEMTILMQNRGKSTEEIQSIIRREMDAMEERHKTMLSNIIKNALDKDICVAKLVMKHI